MRLKALRVVGKVPYGTVNILKFCLTYVSNHNNKNRNIPTYVAHCTLLQKYDYSFCFNKVN